MAMTGPRKLAVLTAAFAWPRNAKALRTSPTTKATAWAMMITALGP
jgi:hypothetical protein